MLSQSLLGTKTNTITHNTIKCRRFHSLSKTPSSTPKTCCRLHIPRPIIIASSSASSASFSWTSTTNVDDPQNINKNHNSNGAAVHHTNTNNNAPSLSPYTPPASLPSTPSAATLDNVLPYLARLAMSEGHLHWRVAASLLALIASKAAGLFAPIYFKHAVDALSVATSSATALAHSTAITAAAIALALSGACRAMSALAKELQHPLFTPVSQAAGRRVSFYALAHVLGLDLHFHLDRNTGALSRMLERGARSIAMIFRAVVFTLAPTALELVAVCVLLARAFQPRVSLLVLATFAAYAAWTVGMTWAATKIRREVKDLDNAISGRAVDALLNVEAVKLADAEQLEVYEYDASLKSYQQASVRLEYSSASLNAGQAIILSAGMTAALIAAATGPGVTAGDMVMVHGLLLQLWAPLQFLGWFYRELRQSLVDMEDLFKLLLTPSSIPDGSIELPRTHDGSTDSSIATSHSGDKTALIHNKRNMDNTTNRHHHASTKHDTANLHTETTQPPGLSVRLHNVKFRYPNSDRDVLKGVTIVAEPGESIAVVGPSGSGKSTLLRLLVRLFDVTDGAVQLDGHNVRSLRASSLRANVAVVPQDTCLFNDTIESNVAYGMPGSSSEDVREAAVAAKLNTAVDAMPEGWSTVVGERGLKLSGGEKQRVAIARAFLRQPRLLICDEATSALDSETERGIMSSLQELAAGRTSVFVAHRLSTIQGCTRIYVLKDGRVAEQGSHAELISQGGVYADMWAMQLAQEALEEHLREDNEDEGGIVGLDSGALGSSSEDDEGVIGVPNEEAVAIHRTL